MSYQNELFKNYHATRSVFLDSSDHDKLAWFDFYFAKLYKPYFAKAKANDAILELGCNKGYLLRTLEKQGYKNLTGIDLSPDDLAVARTLVPNATLICGDAFSYLENNKNTYNIIILKALIEHIEKHRIMDFLHKIHGALREGGMVFIDVQNSDWLFGLHDRYVDFTHEVGFTKESLRQVMLRIFDDVAVASVESPLWGMSKLATIRHKIAKKIVTTLLKWAEPEAVGFDKRLLIATGKKRTR